MVYQSSLFLQQSGQCIALIFLKDVKSVDRSETKTYSFDLVTKDKTYSIACKSDEELYSWMDEIYNVCLFFLPQ